jgi:hypothetical protein
LPMADVLVIASLRRRYLMISTFLPLAGPSTSAVTDAPSTVGAPILGWPSPPTKRTRSKVMVFSSGCRAVDQDGVAAGDLKLLTGFIDYRVHGCLS